MIIIVCKNFDTFLKLLRANKINQKLDESIFDELYNKIINYYNTDDSKTYLFDGFAGFDPNHSLNVRILAKRAWQAHFVNNMFIRPEVEELEGFKPDFTIINASSVFNKSLVIETLLFSLINDSLISFSES